MKGVSVVITGDFCSIHPERLRLGENLNNLLKNTDLKCINFEGPLQVGEIESANGYFLAQSHQSPEWLIRNGFNIVALANNHACDFGESGLRASKDSFKDICTLGCGEGWKKAYSVQYVQVKGKTIGFFNATSADFSSLKDEWTDSAKFGCPWINHPSVPLILQEAKRQCDYLIVLPHAGVEYMDVPLPEWRTIYRSFIDCGADAVVASHPHVPQGWEIYNEKPIYYSLGNFVFEKEPPYTTPHWYNGLVVCLTFDSASVKTAHYCTLFDNNQIEFDTTEESIKHVQTLNQYLSDDAEYMKRVDSCIPSFAIKYEQWLLTGLGVMKMYPFSWKTIPRIIKLILKDTTKEKVFLHQLREESTRWCLQRLYFQRTKFKR